MRVRLSLETPKKLNQDWFIEFGVPFNKINNKKRIQEVQKIFIETYFENIRNGVIPKDAAEKAKTIARCFY